MADRKISELSLASSIAQNDLFHAVTTPGSTPTNQKVEAYKIHRANYNANATFNTITQQILTHSASGQSLTAGHFRTVADNNFGGAPGTAVVTSSTSLLADMNLGDSNGSTTITGEATAFKSSVDLRNTGAAANVYSSVIQFTDDNTDRAYGPTAFIKLQDTKSGSSANVSYVFDLFPDTAYGVSAGQNTGPVFTSGRNADNVANGAILIRVAGEEKYIMLYDALADFDLP